MQNFQKIAVLAVILLVGLTALASAQDDMEAARRQMHIDIMKQTMLYDLSVGHKTNIDLVQFFGMSYLREGLGLSQEQLQKIQQKVLVSPYTIMENEPDYLLLQNEIRKYDPNSPAATEETLKKYADLEVKMEVMRQQKQVSLIYENMTPEQVKKLREFHIATMAETEYVFPGMFEAFDLSDEQKEQFDGIQKEMKPEFEKHVDRMMEYHLKYDEKMQEKLKNVTDPKEKERLWHDYHIVEKVRAEIQPEKDAVMESGKELAKKLKFKMFDVLTDKQWDRMVDLIDNPPDHVKKWVAEFGKRRGNDAGKTGEWRPGPDSWKPGDGIPADYFQHREEQRRFPRRK